MKEYWAPIEGFSKYAVSNIGNVCNLARNNNLLAVGRNRQGISTVGLMRDGGGHTTLSIALLVARAFVSGENSIFDTPISLDGDRTNCIQDNLMWRPRWFAVRYHQQFGLTEFHRKNGVLIEEVNEGRLFNGWKIPAMTYGLRYSDIIDSYLNGTSVFPTRQKFRLYEK